MLCNVFANRADPEQAATVNPDQAATVNSEIFVSVFYFTKLRKIKTSQNAKSLCRLLIYVNHALVVLFFAATNMSFNAIL